MNSDKLGLPIFYQEYPEYFDTPSNLYSTDEKNTTIENLLKKYLAKTILDMTCGTGAQVFHLAKLGYKIIGSDFSPDLLKIAREKASAQNINTHFLDGDMRTLQVGIFDAVITIDNAIGHLVKSDFELAIKNIYKNLKTGGIYIFDILNLDAMTDQVIKADSGKMSDQRTFADGTTISNSRITTIDRENGWLASENNFTFQKNGTEKIVKNKCTLQIYTMEELRLILQKNGFEVLEQNRVDAYTFKQDESGYSILTVAQKQ